MGDYAQVNIKLETSKDQNGVIQPLLTDLYEITMAYAYWKTGKHNNTSSFDLLFRRNPFQGEFTIFAGLEECLKFLKNFHYSEPDMDYIRTVLPPSTEDEFFEYLGKLDTRDIVVYAADEGSVVFPKVPLMRVEGPLLVAQLLETTILNLINYASLVATNAARFRLAAGPDKSLLEFGLRRAQGPDGGLSASRYCYVGGFDGTSNVLAGKLFGIPVKGTHAHAFVNSFDSMADITQRVLSSDDGNTRIDLAERALHWRQRLAPVLGYLPTETSEGELAAFVAYALAFPKDVVCLVDTYDIIRSGVPNFCAVAMALNELGYRAIGVRLDSGDLAYQSLVVRQSFGKIAKEFEVPWFKDLMIVASNDINEDTIHSLNHQGHSIDCFGIGTHLVTCQKQPALGCVYKLTEVNGHPRIKLSEDVEKVTMPGRKDAYRLYGADGLALVDLLQQPDEPPVTKGCKVLCRHPFQESKRAYVTPAKVEPLYKCYFRNGKICQPLPTLIEIRSRTQNSLKHVRMDHKRALNPTPYKLTEVNGHPRIKLSEDVEKVTMPGRKDAYRLYGADGLALVDLLQQPDEPPVTKGCKVLCRHPFQESKRAYVTPAKVEPLYKCYFRNGKICQPLPTLIEIRSRTQNSLKHVRMDHKRALNPTPYKLTEVNGHPRIKLSEDVEKVTMPGRKDAYRLYGADGLALVDLLQQPDEPPVTKGCKVLCRHPFQESKRAYVTPAKVEPLYKCYFRNGKICQPLPTLIEIRSRTQNSLKQVRMDHKRALNPTPYKISVTDQLYNFIHDLWLQNAPIGELS